MVKGKRSSRYFGSRNDRTTAEKSCRPHSAKPNQLPECIVQYVASHWTPVA